MHFNSDRPMGRRDYMFSNFVGDRAGLTLKCQPPKISSDQVSKKPSSLEAQEAYFLPSKRLTFYPQEASDVRDK